MDTESLVARTGAVCQLARVIQRSLAQAVPFRPQVFSAHQAEVADLVDTLVKIETISAATPNLEQAASLSVRLETLNSTLAVLRKLLADTGNLAQVKGNRFSLSRSTRVWKRDEVQRMMLRIRVEKEALESAWMTMVHTVLIENATERDLDSGDSQDSALQISRLEGPALGDFNRIYELHGQFSNPRCSCHRWRFLRSPSILKEGIGWLQIRHDMTFLSMRRCDDANCVGQIAREIADISYIFPKWIWNRKINLIYSSALRCGPSFVLQQRRINPFIGPLYRAATEPDGLEYVKKLLTEGPSEISEVDANGDTLLHFAVRDLNLKCVQMLMRAGADITIRNLEGCSPYSIAWEEILTHKHAWEAETLNSWCKLFGERLGYVELGLPRLHRAYFGISRETFEEVLSVLPPWHIDQVDRNGRTLLCWAAKIGDCETVSKLLSCGADPNHVDNGGFNPLHRSLQPSTSIISATVLLGAKADINARSDRGHTALSIAAGQKDGNSGMIILLMFGANPESEDSKGRTPMFQAAENDKPKNILYLAKAGANMGHVSTLGLTVVDEAVRKNSHEALRFLVPLTLSGEYGIIPMGEDTLYYAAVWGDVETLEILAHGFWDRLDVNGVDDQGLSANCYANFRRDSNDEWSRRYCHPPEDVMLRWERFTAFEKLIETIAKMQQRSVDEPSEEKERWDDAKERVEGNSLPEALHISQQSQAIFRNCHPPALRDCSDSFTKLLGGVSEAFSAMRIEASLSAMVFNRLEQVLQYVLRRSPSGQAFRLSVVIAVKELSKGLTRIMQTLEFSDPPLAEGKIRVRWRCSKCGRNMYDDFHERRPGAVKELEIFLNEGVNRCAGPNDTQSEANVPGNRLSQAEGGGLPQQQSAEENLALVPLSNTYDPRPHFRQQQTIITNCDAEGRWLLVCAKSRKMPTSLSHLDMCTTSSDKELFTTLRNSYMAMRGKWSHRLSLKGVKRIQFVKFELHIRNLVDVKFPAMPPKEKTRTEYLYEQYDTFPPVGENFMAHLFSHPEHANEMSITCLRAPKKLKEKLTVCPQQGAREGWGIHLVEAWVPSKVWLLILFLFLLGSLIFGICWAIFEHDIQGAFGVSGYMVTLAAIVVGTAQTNWADT